MRISDLLSVCLRNLTRRRVRTALTVIGVVIGVCAIILMVSLGIGARESMMQMLQEWGDLTIINVYNYGGGETRTIKPSPKYRRWIMYRSRPRFTAAGSASG